VLANDAPPLTHFPSSTPFCLHTPTHPLACLPFVPRRTSQGDSTQRSVKDLDVVLGRERTVLILDDTEGVWPRHRDNLVQVGVARWGRVGAGGGCRAWRQGMACMMPTGAFDASHD